MATYILLSNFTDQGIRSVKDTTKRAEAFRETARKLGANIKDIYWTLGKYDVVATLEAPDAATVCWISVYLTGDLSRYFVRRSELCLGLAHRVS